MTRIERPEPPTAEPASDPAKSPPAGRPPVREHFIPLRKGELLVALLVHGGLAAEDADRFRRWYALACGLIHRQFQGVLEELKDVYAPFDPDADTRALRQWNEDELVGAEHRLFDRFGWLLARGNFKRLAEEEIERALADRTAWGLNLAVNFEVFERLELYYRGDTVGKRYRRRIRNRLRSESVDVPIFQRLVVIFRLRDEGAFSKYLDTGDVHLKLFKDIPQVDLEMLLPGTRVKMTSFDRARIVLPTVSGVSMAVWKIIAVATAPLYSSLAMLGLVGGTVGYGVRSLFGYLNTRQKYQLNLTQSLYYQNLDNNAGVIHRLVDEAEEQESREVLLAYYFLWRASPPGVYQGDALDAAIEAFLRSQLGQEVDFELADALAKLEHWGLISGSSDGGWRAAPIDEALGMLERLWSQLPAAS